MARSVFLRGLAIVYLIAFASLLPQVDGLIGSNGILPVNDYLDTIDSEYGNTGYALFPTLAWFDSSNTFLHVMIWAGMALAILLFARVLPLVTAIGLWVLYLSLDTAGQIFFSFQWDALLLETGFAAILLTPWGVRPSYVNPPPRMAIWLFRFLVFRLMLESGAVKLLSGDPTWRSFTALNYHYETQPLPTPPAWCWRFCCSLVFCHLGLRSVSGFSTYHWTRPARYFSPFSVMRCFWRRASLQFS